MDFVAKEGERPAVASMSLGGGGSTAMDEAVKRLVDADVTVSVAAGNEYGSACNGSPARAKEVGSREMNVNVILFALAL